MLRKITVSIAQNACTNKRIAFIATSSLNKEKIAGAELHPSKPKKEIEFPSYTIEETAKILQLINNKELAELLNYEITKARASKLLAWQQRNGPLKSTRDILQVEGFSLKTIEKFYESLLNNSSSRADVITSKKQLRNTKFVTPTIDASLQQSIASCVSVRIGVSSVTWARLELTSKRKRTNDPCLLTHWQHHEINEKKLHLHELVQRCLYITHLIPEADCYLFENPQMAQASTNPGSVDQQNINIQKAQMIAILSYALSARKYTTTSEDEGTQEENNTTTPKEHNVFYLRRFLASRLFNNLVGTERVSSEETVLKLMRTYYNKNMQKDYILEKETNNEDALKLNDTNSHRSFRGNVQFPQDLRYMFSLAERYHREFLGQALLLNLAFVHLILLQDPESIAQVTRGPSRDITISTV